MLVKSGGKRNGPLKIFGAAALTGIGAAAIACGVAKASPPLPYPTSAAAGTQAEQAILAGEGGTIPATACVISQRALLTQFKHFLGVSPIAHLRHMRLGTARAKQKPPPVGLV